MAHVLITVKDSSGIRIHYTEALRRYDGGILVNGITISPLHIVPPYQPEYRTAGYCSSHCTQRVSTTLLCPHKILICDRQQISNHVPFKQCVLLRHKLLNTLWTGDADLRLYITTVQDG